MGTARNPYEVLEFSNGPSGIARQQDPRSNLEEDSVGKLCPLVVSRAFHKQIGPVLITSTILRSPGPRDVHVRSYAIQIGVAAAFSPLISSSPSH
jgi:hypothetical protein